jgi:hypothetical protein
MDMDWDPGRALWLEDGVVKDLGDVPIDRSEIFSVLVGVCLKRYEI